MIDVYRYHEISESTHRIMNPLAPGRMRLLGEICRLHSGTRMLDLACGKGEMLSQFSHTYGVAGTGVDIYGPVLAAARARADELSVTSNVDFVEGDAGYPLQVGSFDVVSCLGATWIGGNLAGTLGIMKRYLGANRMASLRRGLLGLSSVRGAGQPIWPGVR